MATKQLKHIILDFFKGTDFKEINNTISIQAAWENMVGKPISKNTKIKSYKNGTITINVSSPIWRNEISLQKQSLLEKLQKIEPSLRINEIILK